MYLPDDEIEFGVLRQGDILQDVPLVGAIALDRYAILSDVAWSVATKAESGFSIVLSHSCEIASENEVKVTSLILAPVREASGAAPPEKFELLKSSNILTPAVTVSFVKYFYLEPNEKLPFPKGAIADFSKLFSLRKQAVTDLIPRKVLQLKPELSAAMAKKLAAYFYRG